MRAQLEKRWREEKYAVLFYSQRHYQAIRTYLKNPQANEAKLNAIIEEAKQQPLTQGSMQNACAHMWGYFKKYATASESARYKELLIQLTGGADEMRCFLAQLADKYSVTYLQNSTILQQKSFGKIVDKGYNKNEYD